MVFPESIIDLGRQKDRSPSFLRSRQKIEEEQRKKGGEFKGGSTAKNVKLRNAT